MKFLYFLLPFASAFVEKFESLDVWVISEAVKEGAGDSDILTYSGEWALESAIENALEGDKGLVAKSVASHHAISSVLKEPIDPKGKPLVIQYEVKLQQGLECGGAYMKLLRYDSSFKASLFDNKSPFVIMFGPDHCGGTNKVFSIFFW